MYSVAGDPAGMRAAAAQLRFRAETLSGIAANVDSDVAALTYVGDAGDRFREAIATGSGSLRSMSARMVNVADTLTRQAAIVEEQQLLEATRLQADQGRY
jgi:uncharacterized protein YukE